MVMTTLLPTAHNSMLSFLLPNIHAFFTHLGVTETALTAPDTKYKTTASKAGVRPCLPKALIHTLPDEGSTLQVLELRLLLMLLQANNKAE